MIPQLIVDSDVINSVAAGNPVTLESLSYTDYPNNPVLLTNGANHTLPALVGGDGTLRKLNTKPTASGINPRSLEQVIALNYLLDPKLDLVVITGDAGVGKSLLACAAAWHITVDPASGPQKTIVFTKTISEVGRHRMGSFPGEASEKIANYMESFRGALSKIAGQDSGGYMEVLETRGKIKFMPINLIRGMSLDNSILVVDEIQNMSVHELKTVATRVGENSRLVLMGDLGQSDESHQGEGLRKLISNEQFKQSSFCAHINLERNERSRLSALIASIL